MSQAEAILAGLGGPKNVQDVEPCITRLRVDVLDQNLVNEAALAEAGAFGVVQVGTTVQVVVGPVADSLADAINRIL